MLTKLRILWASVTPSLETGYGRVTYHVVSRLLDAGIDVICYGLQTYGVPQGLAVKGKMFPMVGTEDAEYEAPVIEKMKKHMADHGRNAIISLWDVWNLPLAFPDNFPTWIPYIPLDAEITAENYYITRNAFRRVAMSNFGHDQLASVGLDSTTILHGVDTQTFRPMPEMKDNLRAKYGFKKDAFVVGWVGKNYYDRKRPDRAIQIFSQFIQRHNIRDAVLYMHMEPIPCKEFCGYNIRRLAELCEVQDLVLTPTRTAVPDQELAEIYNCMDVLLHTSMAEGFGLPLAEAQACGVPVICADNSSQPELVAGHGWVVPCYEWDCRLTTSLHNKWWMIDIDGAVDALEEAYRDRPVLKEYGEMARKFIVDNYDWTAIIEYKWLPFLEVAEKNMLKNPILRNWIIGSGGRMKIEEQKFDNPWSRINTLEQAKGLILTSYLHGQPFTADENILDTYNWNRSRIVLDCACGLGRNWEYLFNHGVERIIAYDFPNMKELCGDKHADKVTWIHPPVSNLDGISYDTALATLAFQHFSEDELRQVLKQIKMGLDDAGRLFVHGRGYLDDRKKNVWKILLDYFSVDQVMTPPNFDPKNGTEDHQVVILV